MRLRSNCSFAPPPYKFCRIDLPHSGSRTFRNSGVAIAKVAFEEERLVLNHPIVSSFVWFLLLWVAAQLGARLHNLRPLSDDQRQDFTTVQTATLTLLGLIIGFSFSMATARYDLRKHYEEEEANAIGTEYVRANLLPAADAPRVQAQLKRYLQLRILFYAARSDEELGGVDANTARLQTEMWNAVQAPAVAEPTPVIALSVSGMNDVLNSQGYTQAAMWNRIPVSAWGLMIAIAVGG